MKQCKDFCPVEQQKTTDFKIQELLCLEMMKKNNIKINTECFHNKKIMEEKESEYWEKIHK